MNTRGNDEEPDPPDDLSPGLQNALAGLDQLGDEIEQAHRNKSAGGRHVRGGVRRRWRRWVLAGLATLLVLVVVGAGYLYYLAHDLQRVTVRGLHSAFKSGQELGTENILMVGSTSRCALAVQNPAYGLCSQGVSGINSDVMMILHADPAHHRLALLSIPRDLFVPNARSTGAYKIDAGLYEGLSQVVAVDRRELRHTHPTCGLPQLRPVRQYRPIAGWDKHVLPDRCLRLGPDGGGADGNQPVSSGLNQKGCVRAPRRHPGAPGRSGPSPALRDAAVEPRRPLAWMQETESDLAGIRRDHEFLRVLASTVAKQGLGNPISDLSLINSLKADLSFDQTWPVSDMVNLVLDFHSTDINSVPQLTLPVQVVTDPEGGWEPRLQGLQLRRRRVPCRGPGSGLDRAAPRDRRDDRLHDRQTAAPARVGVRLCPQRNGRLQPGHRHRDRPYGARVPRRRPWRHQPGRRRLGDLRVLRLARPATEAAAESVVRSMAGAVIMAYDPAEVVDGAQVTVVTGSQFAVNTPSSPPSAPGTGTNASTSPSTTTSTTSVPAASGSAADAIAAPKSPTTQLAPWDPRACAPGAVPVAPTPNPT